jgi:GDPmannose 4,6-dehydratase
MKTALITGIAGQDGSYLSEHLLSLGYRVHGLLRPGSSGRTGRIGHLRGRLELHEASLSDGEAIARLVGAVRPDEIYNLAGESFVPSSFREPERAAELECLAVANLLGAIRSTGSAIRFYQASTSEMFGQVARSPQDETTPFEPRNPYGAAKLRAHQLTVEARSAHGLFAVSGILFNHESPRRGEQFVTRKITLAAARIAAGRQTTLALGNLDARRDWGFSGDYVRAMWMMLQRNDPTDYVVGSGETRTVRQFAEAAFALVGLDWREHVVEDGTLRRPGDVDRLVADPRRARAELPWSPRAGFDDLVRMMVEADVALVAGLGPEAS